MDHFLGEIRLFSVASAPDGWHVCDGAALQIAQCTALYALIGNRYGGDGRMTFCLPDLRGRAMLGQGSFEESGDTITYSLGDKPGSEAVPVAPAQTPLHGHTLHCGVKESLDASPKDNLRAASTKQKLYSSTSQADIMAPDSVSTVGGASHNNMQPSLVLNYCIALDGEWPPREPGEPTETRGLVGEIRAFPFSYAPPGWIMCCGQSLPVAQYQALFAVIGTIYGGFGQTSFRLPDLQGRVAVGAGHATAETSEWWCGRPAGVTGVTLAARHLPEHAHTVLAVDGAANTNLPKDAFWAKGNWDVSGIARAKEGAANLPSTASNQAMAESCLRPVGQARPAPHENRQPSLVFGLCICVDGVFPIRP